MLHDVLVSSTGSVILFFHFALLFSFFYKCSCKTSAFNITMCLATKAANSLRTKETLFVIDLFASYLL